MALPRREGKIIEIKAWNKDGLLTLRHLIIVPCGQMFYREDGGAWEPFAEGHLFEPSKEYQEKIIVGLRTHRGVVSAEYVGAFQEGGQDVATD